MSWSLRKKKEGIFRTVYFVRRIFFDSCSLEARDGFIPPIFHERFDCFSL